MKFRTISWLIGAVAAAGLYGCATMPYPVEPVVKVTQLGPEINRAAQVSAGNVMMQTQKGDHFNAYQLDQTVTCSFLGNSCTVSPQLFVKIRQDEEFYYGMSGKNYFKPFALNLQAQDLSTCPCGVKFSKNDLKVVEAVIEYKNGAIEKMCPHGMDGDIKPVLKPVSMIDIYAPNFLRKTLKFDSFSDGFLALRYMEERGTPNGYDARGNPVAVPPDVKERMYEFDLQTSKTIQVQGASIEILNAQPGKLVYKIIRPLPGD